MALLLSNKILVLILSCFLTNNDDITFSEAKNEVIKHYKLHNAEQELGLKTQFEISDTGFIRYRKTDFNNKSEYYSVKLTELQDLNYLGDEKAGWLLLKFSNEAVIYQTYNDKAGNVDEMLTEIKIPFKNIDVNEINMLYNALNVLKKSQLKH